MRTLKIKHNSVEWHEFRKKGLGGSDASAVIGVNPWKSNIDLFEEKRGRSDGRKVSNSAMEYGNAAEELLVQLFALDNPRYAVNTNKETVYVADDNIRFASIDGELIDQETGDLGGLEIKTTTLHMPREMSKWESKVPDYYYTQILHYMSVTERSFWVLKVQMKLEWIAPLEMVTRQYVFRSDECAEDMDYLKNAELEFWSGVQRNIKPARILPQI